MTSFSIGSMVAATQENQIKQMPIDLLVPYSKHDFTLYSGERRDDMVESIKKNGIMNPIVCRPDKTESGKYEILIGHNRWNCAALAGLKFVPAIVKDNLTDDEAQTYVDESNLLQRGFGDLKISEQARVIARRYSEMFSQGKRNDIIAEIQMLNGETSAPTGQKSETSRDKVGDEYGLGRNTVARLVRIAKLSESLLFFIDGGSLSVRAGVELSYLSGDEQELIFDVCADQDTAIEEAVKCKYKISEKQAKELRALSAEKPLTEQTILSVVCKQQKPPAKKVALSDKIYGEFFAGMSKQEIEATVEAALREYFKNGKDDKNDD